MSRIIAFGCSNTWGDGLPDVMEANKQKDKNFLPASIYAWPNLLQNKLKIKTLNLAKPGKSHKWILTEILKFDFCENDILCIVWPPIDRHCILDRDSNNRIDLGPWWISTDKINQIYYKRFYNPYDSLQDFYRTVDYTNLYIKNLNKNIKIIQVVFDKRDINKDEFPKNFSVDFEDWSLQEMRELYPLAIDNIHPGKEAHKSIANKFYNTISNL